MKLPADGTLEVAATRWADDLDADSLAMIEIVEVAEELVGRRGMRVRIDDDTLAALRTVADLVAALDAAPSTGGRA